MLFALSVCLLLLARRVDGRSYKRGIAIRRPTQAQLQALQGSVDWFYDWSVSPWGGASGTSVNFFPMIYGRGEVDRGLAGYSWALLGFNEPTIGAQSAMSPSEAAGLWPRLEATASANGVQKLVSPAMCGDIGRGTSWMRSFIDACQGCRIDAIAIHSYDCDLPSIQRLVDAYRSFGRPIWLTEFACAVPGRDVSMQPQIQFMNQVVPWLEQEGVIEKYAWFSFFTYEWSYPITSPNPDNGLVYGDGQLSELGRAYLSFGSGRRLDGELIMNNSVHV